MNWYDANTSAFENRHNSGPDNNGNVRRSQSYTVLPGGEQAYYTDDYAYDSLNRLESINGYRSGAHQFIQAYIYDRYGNRTINAALPAAGINKKQFTVNTANNRLGVGVGQTGTMTYDNAGNLTTDTYSGWGLTRAYDAENRMTQETQANNFVASYGYDGDGRRVKRTTAVTGQPSSVVETWQVYGLGGELLAEYAANAAAATPQKEYGYRSGQLLVTATVTAGGGFGSPPVFASPNPLVVGMTEVKAVHITELRTAIDAVRSHHNLAAYAWQYSVTTNDWISANPIIEMRTALDAALSPPAGGYSAGLGLGLPIKAIHIQELRDRVLAAWNSGAGGVDIRWLVADHLGTPRMIFDKTGSLASVSRHDYLPFGEELFAGTGGRTTAEGYTNSDATRQKFTSKERDNETGLDYFLARYYSNLQGRFASADPLYLELRRLGDPQQLNLYSYTRNNPLKFIDPSGLDITVTGTEQEAYRKRLQQDVSFQTQINSKTNKVQIVDANGNVLDKKGLKALGKTLKGGEKELFNAITDTKNHVTIDTVRTDSGVFFGRFDGGGKNTIDFGDVDLLDNPKNAGGFSAGQAVGHETLEAYAASKGKGYNDAHAYANRFFGGLVPPTSSTPIFDSQNANLRGVTADFGVVGKPGVNARVTMQFITPIPAAAINTMIQTGQQRPVHVTNVEKFP